MDCGICFKDMDLFDGQELVCGHFFHVSCLKKWKQTCQISGNDATCPFCRSSKLTPVIHIDTQSKLEIQKRNEESENFKWFEDESGVIHIEDD